MTKRREMLIGALLLLTTGIVIVLDRGVGPLRMGLRTVGQRAASHAAEAPFQNLPSASPLRNREYSVPDTVSSAETAGADSERESSPPTERTNAGANHSADWPSGG